MNGKQKVCNRVGESVVANNGMLMTIICYRSCMDLDVKFSDGTIVKNRTYASFKKGAIKNPNIPEYNVLGGRADEESISYCGLKMKIVVYRCSTDIDVEFEDGVVVRGQSYYHFKSGYIKHK